MIPHDSPICPMPGPRLFPPEQTPVAVQLSSAPHSEALVQGAGTVPVHAPDTHAWPATQSTLVWQVRFASHKPVAPSQERPAEHCWLTTQLAGRHPPPIWHLYPLRHWASEEQDCRHPGPSPTMYWQLEPDGQVVLPSMQAALQYPPGAPV